MKYWFFQVSTEQEQSCGAQHGQQLPVRRFPRISVSCLLSPVSCLLSPVSCLLRFPGIMRYSIKGWSCVASVDKWFQFSPALHDLSIDYIISMSTFFLLSKIMTTLIHKLSSEWGCSGGACNVLAWGKKSNWLYRKFILVVAEQHISW